MKRIFLVLFAATSLISISNAIVLETIDALINDELILSGEVDSQIMMIAGEQKLFVQEGGRYVLPNAAYQKLRPQVLQKMIDEILLMQVVRKQLTEEEFEGIRDRCLRQTDLEMNNFQSEFNTPAKITKKEQEMRMSWEEYRQAIYKQKFSYAIQEVILSQLANLRTEPPSQQELAQFSIDYPNNPPTNEISIQDIQLNFPPNASDEDKEAIRKKAEEIVLQARGGDPFEILVRLFSQNENSRKNFGAIPPFAKGALLPEFDVLFNFKTGEISDPIYTANAYHIAKITHIDSLESRVMQLKKKSKLNEMLVKIRETADIEIRDRKYASRIIPVSNKR